MTQLSDQRPARTDLRYRAHPAVIASDIGDHWALLDLDTSLYYTLNATGATIWDAIQSAATLDQILSAVTEQFAVSEPQCRADVETLLQELVAAGLARLDDGPGDAKG